MLLKGQRGCKDAFAMKKAWIRASSENGVFTLSGGAAYPGTLPQAAQEFIRMLE